MASEVAHHFGSFPPGFPIIGLGALAFALATSPFLRAKLGVMTLALHLQPIGLALCSHLFSSLNAGLHCSVLLFFLRAFDARALVA